MTLRKIHVTLQHCISRKIVVMLQQKLVSNDEISRIKHATSSALYTIIVCHVKALRIGGTQLCTNRIHGLH